MFQPCSEKLIPASRPPLPPAPRAVLLYCEAGCTYTKVLPLEDVIASFNARGPDGENVGIVELARYTTGACPQCGRRALDHESHFPNIPGQMGQPVR